MKSTHDLPLLARHVILLDSIGACEHALFEPLAIAIRHGDANLHTGPFDREGGFLEEEFEACERQEEAKERW